MIKKRKQFGTAGKVKVTLGVDVRHKYLAKDGNWRTAYYVCFLFLREKGKDIF